MAILTLDQARPGMTLDAEVFDRRGRLLLRPGCALTEKHLEALRMWGIHHVEVGADDDEPCPVEPCTPERLAEVEEELDRLFANAGMPHRFLDELRAAARAKAIREVGAGVSAGSLL